MKVYLNLAKKPVTWVAYIDATEGAEIRLKGIANQYAGIYFDRYPITLHKGRNKVEIPIPISPSKLQIEGQRISGAGKVKIAKWEMRQLQREKLTPGERDFMALASRISRDIGAMSTGLKKSPKQRFQVRVYNIIREDGEALETPARVELGTGYMEVSKKKLKSYTIPMRMFILCHEFAHYINDSLDEHAADETGAKLYLKMGFPRSEAFYALTDILPENNQEAIVRINNLGNFLSS